MKQTIYFFSLISPSLACLIACVCLFSCTRREVPASSHSTAGRTSPDASAVSSGTIAKVPTSRSYRRVKTMDGGSSTSSKSGRVVRTPARKNGNRTGSTYRDKRTAIEWVYIQGGSYTMGRQGNAPSSVASKAVKISSLWVQKTEVTVAQYRLCVLAGSCVIPGRKRYCTWTMNNKHLALNCISWSQAVQYAKWAKGRLLSESEWEYIASNGGKNRPFPWGRGYVGCHRSVVNLRLGAGCGKRRPWIPCSKKSDITAAGVCDMAGNVIEWTKDYYHPSLVFIPNSGSPCTKKSALRTVRGASFWSVPRWAKNTSREGERPSRVSAHYGVRLARNAASGTKTGSRRVQK